MRKVKEKEIILDNSPLVDLNTVPPVIHSLKNKKTVMPISNHGFNFSDGTKCPSQKSEIVEALTLTRTFSKVGMIGKMNVNKVEMTLDEKQEELLMTLASMADIVIAPFPVLLYFHLNKKRHLFPNVLAFNATSETQRGAPGDKIVDINNWSW